MYATRTQGRPNATRKPQRLTITVSYALFARIEARAIEEGRSLSNLSAYLLERAVSDLESF